MRINQISHHPFLPLKLNLASKKNKSTGTDGIPYEFNVAFWNVIAPHFHDMFNHILERDSLKPSRGQAVIRMIPKSSGVEFRIFDPFLV